MIILSHPKVIPRPGKVYKYQLKPTNQWTNWLVGYTVELVTLLTLIDLPWPRDDLGMGYYYLGKTLG